MRTFPFLKIALASVFAFISLAAMRFVVAQTPQNRTPQNVTETSRPKCSPTPTKSTPTSPDAQTQSVEMRTRSTQRAQMQVSPTISQRAQTQNTRRATATPQMQPTDSVLLPGIYWENDRKPLQIGQLAPDFSLPLARDCDWKLPVKTASSKQQNDVILNPIEYSNDSSQIGLSQIVERQNGVTVVVFWAFWCDTWKDVSRYFARMKPKLQAEKTQILCVAVDASQQPVARRAFQNGTLWYPVAIDSQSITTANWGVRRVPTLFVLDNSRRVRHVFEGFPGETPLLRAIHNAQKPLKKPTAKTAQKSALIPR